MNQFQGVPGPSQDAFNSLGEQIEAVNSNIGNFKFIKSPATVNAITDKLPNVGDTAVVFFSGNTATALNTSGANYGIFSKGANTPRWDFIFAKQNGLFDIGNIVYSNGEPGITHHQINIANFIGAPKNTLVYSTAKQVHKFVVPTSSTHLIFTGGGIVDVSLCAFVRCFSDAAVGISQINTATGLTLTSTGNNDLTATVDSLFGNQAVRIIDFVFDGNVITLPA